jgi:hypothetical protein
MTKPEITRCSDNHYRRVIYSLAAYIADYPEQALLACIVQGWCAKYIFFTKQCLSSLRRCDRCTAHKDDLDGGSGRRSRNHTELLVSELELGVLWDEYGLVGDIVVHLFILTIAILRHI